MPWGFQVCKEKVWFFGKCLGLGCLEVYTDLDAILRLAAMAGSRRPTFIWLAPLMRYEGFQVSTLPNVADAIARFLIISTSIQPSMRNVW